MKIIENPAEEVESSPGEEEGNVSRRHVHHSEKKQSLQHLSAEPGSGAHLQNKPD